MAWMTSKQKRQEELAALDEQRLQKERDDAVRDSEERTRIAYETRLNWVKALTSREVQDIFRPIHEVLKFVGDTVESRKDSYDDYAVQVEKHGNIVSRVSTIEEALCQLDFTKLSEKHQNTIYDLLSVTIPETSASYRDNFLALGSNVVRAIKANVNEDKSFTNLLIQVLNICDDQKLSIQDRLPRTYVDLADGHGFPSLKAESDDVNFGLITLEELWKEANRKENSVEDEFFLEQLVKDYLPNAWRLYGEFLYASDVIRKQAEVSFLEQLSLLQGRVQSIINTHAERSLAALRANASFLRDQTDKFGNNSLTDAFNDER